MFGACRVRRKLGECRHRGASGNPPKAIRFAIQDKPGLSIGIAVGSSTRLHPQRVCRYESFLLSAFWPHRDLAVMKAELSAYIFLPLGRIEHLRKTPHRSRDELVSPAPEQHRQPSTQSVLRSCRSSTLRISEGERSGGETDEWIAGE